MGDNRDLGQLNLRGDCLDNIKKITSIVEVVQFDYQTG